MRKLSTFWLAFIIAFISDQISKWYVFTKMFKTPDFDDEQIMVVKDVLQFSESQNTGAAFGMKISSLFHIYTPQQYVDLEEQHWIVEQQSNLMYIIISSAVIIGIYFFVRKLNKNDFWPLLSFGLIVGGATGNLVDRLVFGYVRDFIEILYPVYWPVFNVADSIICLGVSCFTVEIYREWKAERKPPKIEEPPKI